MGAKRYGTRELVFAALFVVFTAVCSWISVPSTVPFTMQTFAVFAAMLMLGGRRAFIAAAVYIVMGAVGLPVFSNFQGGFGVLLGPAGGYVIGFLPMTLIYWAVTARFGKGRAAVISAMLLGLLVCYAFGTAHFVLVYMKSGGVSAYLSALMWCVVPYIVPDIVKLALALVLGERLKRYRLN